jgi:hypothetical protein
LGNMHISELTAAVAKEIPVALIGLVCISTLQARAAETMSLSDKQCLFDSLLKFPTTEGIKIVGATVSPDPKVSSQGHAGREFRLVDIELEIAGQPATIEFSCVAPSPGVGGTYDVSVEGLIK